MNLGIFFSSYLLTASSLISIEYVLNYWANGDVEVTLIKMAEVRCPDVIKFAYIEYQVDQSKKFVTAKCKTCRATIREKSGTTSAFVRHLSTASHPTLRTQ